ncbi:MAG TPA: TadE/TadG family type IV pilus assembly protein [Euzebyales bacterium]|nr:TadE/TadG family type IV pilus assembly protein [Euzebyales bacterium]
MEMAVVLLPLLLLLFGVVEFARVYSTQLRLQHAAREAAREIALKHDDPGVLGNLGVLQGIVDNTLDDLVGDLLDDVATNIVYCDGEVEDARVALAGEVDLVLPLPGDQLGSVPVAAEAVMACEA